MPNRNYLKGRTKEYKLKKELEREGKIVLRTAGSHGFADLISVDPKTLNIGFIQCKPNNFSEKEKNKLMSKYDFLNTDLYWITRFEVI